MIIRKGNRLVECCHFLWIVHFLLTLRYSLTFIMLYNQSSGAYEKKLFWMKWCLFYFYLTFVYNCYVPTYHRFLRQRLRHERYLFSVYRGILPAIFGRFSKKLSTSRAPEKYFTRLWISLLEMNHEMYRLCI
jgi:hypothetical protein